MSPYSRNFQMRYNMKHEKLTKTIRIGRVYHPVVYRDYSGVAVSRSRRGEMAWSIAVRRRTLGRVGNILSLWTAAELV